MRSQRRKPALTVYLAGAFLGAALAAVVVLAAHRTQRSKDRT